MQCAVDRDTLQALCGACLTALNGFVDEANKTCSMLRNLKQPVSFEDKMKVLEQRSREYEEYERYRRARQTLFTIASEVAKR